MERLAVAFVSAFIATLTIGIVSVVLAIIYLRFGGESEPLILLLQFIFSKGGAAMIAGISVLGFLLGAERMVNIFSIVWGTHNFWSRVADRLNRQSENGMLALWLFLAFLILIALVLVLNNAKT